MVGDADDPGARSKARRTRRPESRRQELLDAALRLYLERGVGTSTVAEVTEAAGAAKGTFYRYFPSKEHLLLALRDRFTDELLATLEEDVAAAAGSRWDQLEAVVRTLVEFGRENAHVHDVVYYAGHDGGLLNGDDPFETRIVRWVAGFLRDGAADGCFDCDDPDLVALLSFSALHGCTEQALEGGHLEHERLVAGLTSMLSRAFGRDRHPV
jgi:AcrR family transcriptional regulator